MNKYAKVLIVNGEPFNSSSATGITLSNLFKGWPKENLMQIYTANIEPNKEICKNNIKFGTNNLFPISVFSGSTVIYSEGGGANRVGQNYTGPINNGGLKSSFRYFVAPVLDFLPYDLNRDVLERIANFKPDVIYSILGNIRIAGLVTRLASKFDIPVVPHFMDDWVSTYSVPGKSGGTFFHKIILEKKVRELFKHVPHGMSIGSLMAKIYTERYGKPFSPFMNPVEAVAIFDESRVVNDVVRFSYVGGLHLNRDNSLAEIIEAMILVLDKGYKCEFEIYAPDSDAEKARALQKMADFVYYRGSVASDKVFEILNSCDVAVHVESFDEDFSGYTKYSVSTKIPQYFAAAVPILAFGPEGLASCQYVVEMNAGVHIKSKDELSEALMKFISDKNWRNKLGCAGHHAAKKYHVSSTVRIEFAKTLGAALHNKRRGSV
jgi:glycosyltransferase involved in cell wall biosynthesis